MIILKSRIINCVLTKKSGACTGGGGRGVLPPPPWAAFLKKLPGISEGKPSETPIFLNFTSCLPPSSQKAADAPESVSASVLKWVGEYSIRLEYDREECTEYRPKCHPLRQWVVFHLHTGTMQFFYSLRIIYYTSSTQGLSWNHGQHNASTKLITTLLTGWRRHTAKKPIKRERIHWFHFNVGQTFQTLVHIEPVYGRVAAW